MNSPLPPPSARLMFSMSPPPPSCTTSLPTLAVWPVRSNVAQSTHDVPSVSTPSWRRSRQQLMPTKRYRLEKKTLCFFYSIHAVFLSFSKFRKDKNTKKAASPDWSSTYHTSSGSSFLMWINFSLLCFSPCKSSVSTSRFSECAKSVHCLFVLYCDKMQHFTKSWLLWSSVQRI